MSGGDNLESFETPEGMAKHRPKRETDGTPSSKAQRNFTAPDSRIMKDDSFMQGYNGQAAVDRACQVIVGCGLTNQASDADNLLPMLQGATGALPEAILADSGYWTDGVVNKTEQMCVEPYIAVGREKQTSRGSTVNNEPQPEADPRTRMRRKLRTKEGRNRYGQRKAVVEPVVGQMKEARGFRRFHLRGIDKARAEWSLVCTGHNLQKLYGVLGDQSGIIGPDGGW